jgi:hypothetical protein
MARSSALDSCLAMARWSALDFSCTRLTIADGLLSRLGSLWCFGFLHRRGSLTFVGLLPLHGSLRRNGFLGHFDSLVRLWISSGLWLASFVWVSSYCWPAVVLWVSCDFWLADTERISIDPIGSLRIDGFLLLRWGSLEATGFLSVIGSLVSAGFLILFGSSSMWSFTKLVFSVWLRYRQAFHFPPLGP